MTDDPNAGRFQFRLRSIFLLILSAAVLSALYRVAAQLDVLVLGTAPAIWTTTAAIRARRQRRRVPLPVWIVSGPAWLAAYVVSVGPVILVVKQFDRTMIGFLGYIFWIYLPIEWLHKHTPLRSLLDWYVSFWHQLG